MNIAKDKFFKKIVLFLIIFRFIFCYSASADSTFKDSHNNGLFNTGKNLEQLMAEIPPLAPEKAITYSNAVIAYFRFYGFDFENVYHRFGYIDLEGYAIATHLFIPSRHSESSGTVYLFHSYITHSGLMNELIAFLLYHGYSICAVDLPGHGFSSGARGDIDDFHEYGDILDALFKQTSSFLEPPYYAIGHSTGCSVIIDYILRYKSKFQSHILLAPLVHSDMWWVSRAGYFLAGWVIKRVPNWQRDVSSDKEYKKYMRDVEPLQNHETPLTWVKALFDWNRYLNSLKKTSNAPLYIIQGKKDIVVDWRYNIPYLQKKFPGMDVTYIKEGKHNLHKECKQIKEEVFRLILTDLEKAAEQHMY